MNFILFYEKIMISKDFLISIRFSWEKMWPDKKIEMHARFLVISFSLKKNNKLELGTAAKALKTLNPNHNTIGRFTESSGDPSLNLYLYGNTQNRDMDSNLDHTIYDIFDSQNYHISMAKSKQCSH